MVRITSRVFSDLAIWMIAFGIVVGLIFPPFVVLMGVPAVMVIKPGFFALCIAAGVLVGAVNIALARGVIGKRLQSMAQRMARVEKHVDAISKDPANTNCSPEDCYLPVDSDDEIGRASQAFNNLTDSTAHTLQTLSSVHTFTEMLTGQLDLSLLAQQALRQLLTLTRSDAGALLVEEGGMVTLAAEFGIAASSNLAEGDHIRQGLRTGARQHITLPEDVMLDGVVTDFRPHEIIVEPIRYKGVPLGILVLASARGYQARTDITLDLLHNGMALALNNALAHERLQRLAAIDPLTGVYNRRFGMARFHEEYTRAIRLSAPLGVMMINIDHFKTVNDTYGHLVGDKVLTRVAQLIRANIREGDLIMRYGGEEYLVILPAASGSDTHLLGERLRRVTEEMTIKDGDQVIRITISVGAAAYPELDTEDEQDLIKRADDALYRAKQTGRNKVLVA
jgi:diguanylate cyclase (GGDEF)-like protein